MGQNDYIRQRVECEMQLLDDRAQVVHSPPERAANASSGKPAPPSTIPAASNAARDRVCAFFCAGASSSCCWPVLRALQLTDRRGAEHRVLQRCTDTGNARASVLCLCVKEAEWGSAMAHIVLQPI